MRLPPELVLHLLPELCTRDIKNLSLTCKPWHELCLPFIFREITIREHRHLLEWEKLVSSDPPSRLCRFVRRMVLERNQLNNLTDVDDVHMLRTVTRGLTKLSELIAWNLTSAIFPSILAPPSAITNLHVVGLVGISLLFLQALHTCANTLRCLTLRGVSFFIVGWPSVHNSHPSQIRMNGLEELAIIDSSTEFTSQHILFPSLKILFCDDSKFIGLRGCIPLELNTLVVTRSPYESMSATNPFSVDNVCFSCNELRDANLASVEQELNKYTTPSKIKHLEVLRRPPNYDNDVDVLRSFEDTILGLHQHGSLQRLTITSDYDNRSSGDSKMRAALSTRTSDKFPRLRDLGLLDVRVGQPSLLYPRCSEDDSEYRFDRSGFFR